MDLNPHIVGVIVLTTIIASCITKKAKPKELLKFTLVFLALTIFMIISDVFISERGTLKEVMRMEVAFRSSAYLMVNYSLTLGFLISAVFKIIIRTFERDE